MKRKGPFVVYGLVGVALMIALIAAPGVWATTGQSDNAQTVPTRTPVPPPVQVTEPPEEENTPVPPTNTPAPPASTTVPPALATTQPRATATPTAVPVTTRS